MDTARAEKSTAGGLDDWAWNEIKALPLPWFSGLAILSEHGRVNWGYGHRAGLILFFAMILKADGDFSPLGQRSLGVLPLVCRLWASLRLGHLKERVQGWVPESVFSVVNGVSLVEAWFSTALDIEEVFAQIGGDQLHVMVADVINSFDTVDRSTQRGSRGRGVGDFSVGL